MGETGSRPIARPMFVRPEGEPAAKIQAPVMQEATPDVTAEEILAFSVEKENLKAPARPSRYTEEAAEDIAEMLMGAEGKTRARLLAPGTPPQDRRFVPAGVLKREGPLRHESYQDMCQRITNEFEERKEALLRTAIPTPGYHLNFVRNYKAPTTHERVVVRRVMSRKDVVRAARAWEERRAGRMGNRIGAVRKLCVGEVSVFFVDPGVTDAHPQPKNRLSKYQFFGVMR